MIVHLKDKPLTLAGASRRLHLDLDFVDYAITLLYS